MLKGGAGLASRKRTAEIGPGGIRLNIRQNDGRTATSEGKDRFSDNGEQKAEHSEVDCGGGAH